MIYRQLGSRCVVQRVLGTTGKAKVRATARASACRGRSRNDSACRSRAASTLVWERLQQVTKATSAVTFGNLSKKQAHKRKYINHIHFGVHTVNSVHSIDLQAFK